MNAMKHVRATLAVTLFCTLAAQSALACKTPDVPRSIPDGRKAEMQVMLETKRQVEAYFQQVSDYMACENNGLKLQEVKATQKDILKQFNDEVRAFQAANPIIASRH